MSEFKCKQMQRKELQVVGESQMNVLCPKCNHYCNGLCVNPARKTEDGPCPFDNKPLPVQVVEENVDPKPEYVADDKPEKADG